MSVGRMEIWRRALQLYIISFPPLLQGSGFPNSGDLAIHLIIYSKHCLTCPFLGTEVEVAGIPSSESK